MQISRAVLKYHQEQKSKEVKAEKEESVRLRKIAASIAKEIKQFWSSVEKVVLFYITGLNLRLMRTNTALNFHA